MKTPSAKPAPSTPKVRTSLHTWGTAATSDHQRRPSPHQRGPGLGGPLHLHPKDSPRIARDSWVQTARAEGKEAVRRASGAGPPVDELPAGAVTCFKGKGTEMGVRAPCCHPMIRGRSSRPSWGVRQDVGHCLRRAGGTLSSWPSPGGGFGPGWAAEGKGAAGSYLPGSGAGTCVCPALLASFGTLSP